jgi:hypothetical protein
MVYTVAHTGEPRTHSERVKRWHTVVGVSRRKSFFQSGRPASKFMSMVVKLVGQ